MKNLKSKIIILLLVSGFIFVQFSACAFMDTRAGLFSGDYYYNQFEKIIKKTTVSVLAIAYYDGPDSLDGSKKGFMTASFGRGSIYFKNHHLITNYHVINPDAYNIVNIGKRFGYQVVKYQLSWKLKKVRYFIVKDCAELNRVRARLSGYIADKSQIYPGMFNYNSGQLLKCVSEEDFDNFFTMHRDNLKNIYEFNIATYKDDPEDDTEKDLLTINVGQLEKNPDKFNLLFRGDKVKDYAVVRLAGLDGKFDYMRLEDVDTEELKMGQEIYMWGAPGGVTEQLYKGIIANTHFYDYSSNRNIEINRGSAEDKSENNESATDNTPKYKYVDYFGLTSFDIIPGSSGSPLFYFNKEGKLKIIGIASFCFPPPPYSFGYGYVKVRYIFNNSGLFE